MNYLDDEFLITPPSAIAACCVLSAILGNETWSGEGNKKDAIMASLIELIGSDSVSKNVLFLFFYWLYNADNT